MHSIYKIKQQHIVSQRFCRIFVVTKNSKFQTFLRAKPNIIYLTIKLIQIKILEYFLTWCFTKRLGLNSILSRFGWNNSLIMLITGQINTRLKKKPKRQKNTKYKQGWTYFVFSILLPLTCKKLILNELAFFTVINSNFCF